MVSMSERTASMRLARFTEEVQLCLHLLLACRLSAARPGQSLALALAVICLMLHTRNAALLANGALFNVHVTQVWHCANVC